MDRIIGIKVSDELSEMGGVIIYQMTASGKFIRQEVPQGSVEMYEDNGIPVLY